MSRRNRSTWTRNALIGIVFTGIVFVALCGSNISPARAQDASTPVPTDTAPKTLPWGLKGMIVSPGILASATPDSYEPDNNPLNPADASLAKPILSGTPQAHSIAPIGDVDWVTFSVSGPTPSSIILQTNAAWSDDTVMSLYDSGMNLLAYNDDANPNTLNSLIRRCGTAGLPAGTYYAQVEKRLNDAEINLYNLSYNVVSKCMVTRADFDNNGWADIALFRPSSGTWYVLNQFGLGFGAPGDIPVIGDYNGDAITDIAVYRPSTGMWYVKDQFAVGFGGVPGDVPVPADYNGDGKTDVAIFRGGAWYVKDQFATVFGAPGDIPVPADYNGDGKADLAVFRNGVWYVKDQFATVFGTAGDIPVPGDYNGDGKADVAVFRGGIWYVKDQFATVFGAPGDIPVPGDYNGDGKTDIAVYRPSTGMWYVKDQFAVGFGGVPGDYPVIAPDTNGNGTPYQ